MTESKNTPMTVDVVLNSIQKIVAYCYLVRRFFEQNPDFSNSKRKVPMLYPCPSCKKKALVHVLSQAKKPEVWVCPNCGKQKGPGQEVVEAQRVHKTPENVNTNARVYSIRQLEDRASKAGLSVVKEVNAEGKETFRSMRLECPICKSHAEKLGKPYSPSAIRVYGDKEGLCCTRVMNRFGAGCGGWHPVDAKWDNVARKEI